MSIAHDDTPDAPTPPPLEYAHHQPPPHIRAFHKKLQKAPDNAGILDFSSPDLPEYHRQRLKLSGTIPADRAANVFAWFEDTVGAAADGAAVEYDSRATDIPIYTHSSVPGLLLVPSLLPIYTQSSLLTTLLTRALADTQTHRTNLHAFYMLPHPLPWFATPPTTSLQPLTDMHKPITLSQALRKKLRWMTLGGQYDWTAKRYPPSAPPPFPADVAGLVNSLFSDVTPQAAIVNLYSPGDQLAPHRDIAESVGKGLVSISVGCAGVFVIGCEGMDEVLAVRLNSGDAVVMRGESRWAWHSVPKILGDTCPGKLEQWNGGSEEWRGWMKGKRVNLNVRQMWD